MLVSYQPVGINNINRFYEHLVRLNWGLDSLGLLLEAISWLAMET